MEAVRERAHIEEIVGQHVTLRSAGVGSMKGLCPFHDERSPSFHVRPQVGRYHCFGCGEGGDVIDFVQKVDGLGFSEAVEYLAGKVGLQLRYEEGGAPRPGEEPGKRRRLIEAHKVAEEFYREQLSTPAAAAGRAVPRRARLRPDRRRGLRGRVRAAGLGLAHAAPARPRVHRGGADAVRAGQPGAARRLRPVPRPAGVAHPRGDGGDRRLRCASPVRGGPGAQVPEHPRDRRSTRSRRCSTASTWPSGTCSATSGWSSSRGTPTSWPCTCPASAPPSPRAAPRSAPTTRASCAGSSATPGRPAASSWRPARRSAARSSSRSTATRPVRRPRCGRSARTSRSPRRRSSPSRSPAWTRASCARPRAPTPSARWSPAGRRCTSSSSARRSRPTTCAPPRVGSAPCARPPRSSRASATPRCGPSTRGC